MSRILETVALFGSAVYLGATVYVMLVEHPARLACSTEVAWAQWMQSVRWTPRYAASALVAAVAALMQGRVGLASPWTWGSVLLLAVLPYTVMALLPIQRRLTEAGWDGASAATRTQLVVWGRRHAVRAWLGLVAFVLFLSAAL